MYSERVKKAVAQFSEIYGVSENAYKQLQSVLLQIDEKIHNEFRYCSRGLRDFIQGLDSSTEDESIERLQRASQAAKNAFNDSIDLVVGFASISISVLARMATTKAIALYIPNLVNIMASIAHINRQIAESRESNFNRFNMYKEILASNEFKTVLDYCDKHELIEGTIEMDNQTEKRNLQIIENTNLTEKRKFLINMAIAAITILLTILGIVVSLL